MEERAKPRPQASKPAGAWEPPALSLDEPAAPSWERVLPGARLLHGVLSLNDCRALAKALEDFGGAHPVSVQGRTDTPDARVGSVRATAWSPVLAEQLWQKLRAAVPQRRSMRERTSTDWYMPTLHLRWRAVGVSPVLRFMRYEAGGEHYAHYDAAYDFQDGRRSLMSLVFYLTSSAPESGGRTRFIKDKQAQLPVWRRDHSDWPRASRPDEVRAAVRPQAGSVLVFDHRICHDVEPYQGDTSRVIIRGDLVYLALP